jgi:hypothetical protein
MFFPSTYDICNWPRLSAVRSQFHTHDVSTSSSLSAPETDVPFLFLPAWTHTDIRPHVISALLAQQMSLIPRKEGKAIPLQTWTGP